MMRLERTIESVTGRKPDRIQLERFSKYLELLTTWNRVQRLTGARTPQAITGDLLIDSVLFLSQIPAAVTELADLGSGPGIPGVPIQIVRPGIAVTLVEAMAKRVSFLLTVKRELGLTGLTVLEGRAELLLRKSSSLAGRFDVAVSRSVGPEMVETAIAYLKPGGLYISGAPPLSSKVSRRPEFGRYSSEKATRTVIRELGIERSFVVVTRPSD